MRNSELYARPFIMHVSVSLQLRPAKFKITSLFAESFTSNEIFMGQRVVEFFRELRRDGGFRGSAFVNIPPPPKSDDVSN